MSQVKSGNTTKRGGRKTTRRVSSRRHEAAKQRLEWHNSPQGRLTADGASKSNHIAQRLLWLACEWQLPRPPLVRRYMSKELREYVEAHGISWDWLYLGDLKGLQCMMLKRRMRAIATPESLLDKLSQLLSQVTALEFEELLSVIKGHFASRKAGEVAF